MKFFLRGFIGTLMSPFMLMIIIAYQTGRQSTRLLMWVFDDA